MKVAVINSFGEPGVLEITDVPKPAPNDDEVLIKIRFTSINPVDTKVRAGTSGFSKKIQFPIILGWDASGIIEIAGKNVKSFKAGDEVFGCIGFPGLGKTYAEYAVANPALLAKKPANISFEEAAAVPLVGLTAYQAIHDHLQIKKDQKVLITAAAGGVGHLAVQFAKLNGAYVYGTSSEKNEKFLKSLGIDKVINYKNEKFEDIIDPLDAVLDAMGGDILYRSIHCVKPGGKVACLPSSTKNDPEAIRISKENNIEMIWPMMYSDGGQMQIIAGLLEEKKLKVRINRIFTLDQVQWAHEAVETHQTDGKVVVKIE